MDANVPNRLLQNHDVVWNDDYIKTVYVMSDE